MYHYTAGLRDLADFLPASLAAIVSYFSEEITGGTWKPVMLNGSDWPSPAATLPAVESQIKEVLASAGVHVSISARPRMSMSVHRNCSILFVTTLYYHHISMPVSIVNIICHSDYSHTELLNGHLIP